MPLTQALRDSESVSEPAMPAASAPGHTSSAAPSSPISQWNSRWSWAYLLGYAWAIGGVTAATGLFRLMRGWLETGQASLLYLPVVIACAVRFGFGPAVVCAVLSFFCWDFFFYPPLYAFAVENPRNWLALFVFLGAAVTTARLAARVRWQAREAEARQGEMALLYQASEVISQELEAERLLATLAEQVIRVCSVSGCCVLSRNLDDGSLRLVARQGKLSTEEERDVLHNAETMAGKAGAIVWNNGLFIPLRVRNHSVGVMHVGSRPDGVPFTSQDERLILTLANHAAVVIARQNLAEEAKQQARQAAILNERNRLAKDVHDTLSHSFTGIKFLLEAALRVGPAPNPRSASRRRGTWRWRAPKRLGAPSGRCAPLLWRKPANWRRPSGASCSSRRPALRWLPK